MIATLVAKYRVLSPAGTRVLHRGLDLMASLPTIGRALHLVLLTPAQAAVMYWLRHTHGELRVRAGIRRSTIRDGRGTPIPQRPAFA